MKKINFWDTDVGLQDFNYQKKIFKSNFPNEGSYVIKLQDKIKKMINVKYCIALPSCTSALYLAVKILNLKKDDEILIPNITFAASANAAFMAGIKIKFVDVNPKTLNIDLTDLNKKINKNTKAIMPVHVSGRACDMSSILRIAKRKKVFVIEDAAEAFLSKHKKKYLGTFGDMGCFSLSPNKIFTSGQGGLLVTNNKLFYKRLSVFKTQGRIGATTGGNDLHISAGGNFKLSNISAGLAITQLKKVNHRKKVLIRNHLNYKRGLKDLKKIKVVNFDIRNRELPLWTDVICENRDKLFNFLKKNKIICRKFWYPLSKKNFYSNQKHSSFKNTKKIENKIMWLPSSFMMKSKEQKFIIDKIFEFYS
mgnify:CR=1 FL=1